MARSKTKVFTRGENGRGESIHYFASSIGEWRVDTDLPALIESMKHGGLPFNVWLVPGPKDSSYGIEMYSPQVEGAQWIAFVEFNKG